MEKPTLTDREARDLAVYREAYSAAYRAHTDADRDSTVRTVGTSDARTAARRAVRAEIHALLARDAQ